MFDRRERIGEWVSERVSGKGEWVGGGGSCSTARQ